MVKIFSKLEFQLGMDSFLVYHVNVIYVAQVRLTCMYVYNENVINFKQYDRNR